MILGDPDLAPRMPQGESRLTIDEVFRHRAQRDPYSIALVDPDNRDIFTDGAPRRLTYAEADRVIAAIAARLQRMVLPPDAIIGVQLPNIAENILTILGVLRAGMIVAPVPLLWRRAEAVAALARVGAKALITCRRVGAFNHCELAMQVAAEVFSIRYLGAFGNSLPDGLVSFEDLLSADGPDEGAAAGREPRSNATAHIAAITFDVGADGIVPVARTHAEFFAGGLGVLLESRLAAESGVLSTILPSSFAGISLTLLPWLLSGGALVLHQPFDPEVLARQRREERCGALLLPGPMLPHLTEMGVLSDDGPTCVIAAWRSPERLAASQAWLEANATLVDVSSFGEVAVVPARRRSGGRPASIMFGPVTVPRESRDSALIAELARTEAGTVAVRGAMVPHHAFPNGVEATEQPHFKIGPGGWVDSGYACHVDSFTKAMVVTGRPAGIVNIGGYRFPLRQMQEVISRIDSGARLATLPYPLIGQRVIGNAADRNAMQTALDALGINPLVVGAFRDRWQAGREETAASAAA